MFRYDVYNRSSKTAPSCSSQKGAIYRSPTKSTSRPCRRSLLDEQACTCQPPFQHLAWLRSVCIASEPHLSICTVSTRRQLGPKARVWSRQCLCRFDRLKSLPSLVHFCFQMHVTCLRVDKVATAWRAVELAESTGYHQHIPTIATVNRPTSQQLTARQCTHPGRSSSSSNVMCLPVAFSTRKSSWIWSTSRARFFVACPRLYCFFFACARAQPAPARPVPMSCKRFGSTFVTRDRVIGWQDMRS